jgi:predicted DNA-binding transcriptional regulator AlpA
MMMQTTTPVRALKTTAAARYLGLSPSWLRKRRLSGEQGVGLQGPKFMRLGNGLCLYEVAELDRWLDDAAAREPAYDFRPPLKK